MPRRERLTPRNRGLAILVGCASCIALNLFMLRSWGEFYVILFPLGFGLAPIGLTLLITGVSAEDIRSGKMSLGVTRLMLASMVVGAVLGVVANHSVSR